MSIYSPHTVVSCLSEVDAEVAARLLAPPVQPEREQAPGLLIDELAEVCCVDLETKLLT